MSARSAQSSVRQFPVVQCVNASTQGVLEAGEAGHIAAHTSALSAADSVVEDLNLDIDVSLRVGHTEQPGGY
jgi:hypothetical protein